MLPASRIGYKDLEEKDLLFITIQHTLPSPLIKATKSWSCVKMHFQSLDLLVRQGPREVESSKQPSNKVHPQSYLPSLFGTIYD